MPENLKKYGIEATLSESRGEDYNGNQKFDLIILDAPCSNSGVLNKRPEARWRLSAKALQELENLQLMLIKKTTELLSDRGIVLYMSCSILKQENEQLVEKAMQNFGLQSAGYQECLLPNSQGWDGGFACALEKKK